MYPKEALGFNVNFKPGPLMGGEGNMMITKFPTAGEG